MPPSPFLGVWKISGREVTVDAKTEIKGSPAVGDRVHVKAMLSPALGSPAGAPALLALSIEKK